MKSNSYMEYDYALPRPIWCHLDPSCVLTKSIGSNQITIKHNKQQYLLQLKLSNWDSKLIGKDVYRLHSLRCVSDVEAVFAHISLHDWQSVLKRESIIWARISSEAGQVIRCLESSEFRYVSGLNTYIWATSCYVPTTPGIVIRAAIAEDLSAIGEIGAGAFLSDRFFLDPAIARGIASEMYREWSVNCANGLCKTMLVAEIEGVIAGFVSINPDNLFSTWLGARHQRIILIAVSPLFRGRGIGIELVNAAKRKVVEEGDDFLLVGTSSLNVPAQNLYQKCCFKSYYTEICMEKSIKSL